MLNRIYIIVGLLAIIVLAGAFIVPRFVQWGDYRGRMEALSSDLLGTPVTIRGEIDFALLPQPRLRFTDVLVGEPEEPAATVDAVEAEFSLMDFLRDNYRVTRLLLDQPVVDFTIDESGFLGSGVTLSSEPTAIALTQATITNGTVRLLDRRSGENFIADAVSGEVRLGGTQGPFTFQGSGQNRGQGFTVRFNSAAQDAQGQSRVSVTLRSADGIYSVSSEGLLTPGMAPKYDGTLVYRQTPPTADAAEDIAGDLVFETRITGSTDRIVMSGYTLQPDENRAGTRLTGAASIQLGTRRSFDAVVSGGAFALPPRPADEESASLPYEIVRLLAELPAPPVPPITGRIGVDLAEVGLRGFALRNVRIDAVTDGDQWQVQQATARLPGDTAISLAGVLQNAQGRPEFRGTLTMDTQRLDALAALWRSPDEANTLFNEPATLQGQVLLGGDALGLSDGRLKLAGRTHAVEIRLGYGEEKRLDLVAHFDALANRGSQVLGALLPPAASDPQFLVSFPEGSFSLSAVSAELLGQAGRDIAAEGQWTPGGLNFSRLRTADWGGVTLDGRGSVSRGDEQPTVTASARVAVANAGAAGLTQVYDWLALSPEWRQRLAASAPADLLIDLLPPSELGAQELTLGGQLGAGSINGRLALDGPIVAMATAPLELQLSLEGDDAARLAEQLGLGRADIFATDAPMLVHLGLQGAGSAPLDISLTASAGAESLSYRGTAAFTAQGVDGEGQVTASLTSGVGLAEAIGAGGVALPGFSGEARLQFGSDGALVLADLAGTAGDDQFTGRIEVARVANRPNVTGTLQFASLHAQGLAAMLLGPAALVGSGADGVWPEGPLDLGAGARAIDGSLAISTQSLILGDSHQAETSTFTLDWDATRTRLSRFSAQIGGGTVDMDLAVCCAGANAEKTLNGRIIVADADVDAVTSPAVAAVLDGTLSGGVSFEGTGASLGEIMNSLAGEGNVVIADFAVDRLAPEVFPSVAALQDVLDTPAEDLQAVIGVALGQGRFVAAQAGGTFAIAGGTLRLGNFIVETDGARLAGDLDFRLRDLGLDGSFVLAPRGFSGTEGLVGDDISRIVTTLGGTLLAPTATLDLDEIVAALQVRANEIELDRLETLQQQDAERQRAAAEERNRLIEEQRQRAAAEAARLAAEEEARRAAEEASQPAPTPAPAPATPNQTILGPLTLPGPGTTTTIPGQ